MGEEEEEEEKKKKKGYIREEDVSLLLQRYSATTILALLQEVSQIAGAKIDWKALVKRTSTGITSAREYQMLWRHLAYRDTLLEKLEDGTEPLDDDSDLEFEVEAVPAVSGEASLEAAACVKVLISSGSQRESCPTSRSTVEAPLSINIPDDQTLRVPLDKQQPPRCTRGINITIPVSVQTGPSAEPDENGSAGSGLPAKKKRKLWTKEEDMELIAAVQKCGEGNWANILKGDFKHDRTASQLSQRWAVIRKRQANSKPGTSNKSSNSTRSEERLAAQKAISLAIDMPMTRSLSTLFAGATQSSTPASSSTISAPLSEAQPISAPQGLTQSQQATNQAASQKGASNPSNKPRTTPKKLAAPVMPSARPNSSIQAAAFAAGGRIAAPSTAASLIKAAQSKSAFHIRPVGVTLPKSLVTGPKSSPATNTLASVQNLGAQVHHIHPVMMPQSSNSGMTMLGLGSQQTQGCAGKPASSSATSCPPASNQSTHSETKSGTLVCTSSQENAGTKSGIIISTIDVDELLTEQDGDADEMELDAAAVQDHQTGLRCLDVDENHDRVVDNAVNSQAAVDGIVNLLKSGSSESQTGDNKAELADMGAAEDRSMIIDAGGTQIPAERGIGMSSESQGVANANDRKQDMAQEQLECMEVSADQTKDSQNILVGLHSDLEHTVPGSKSPHYGQAGVD